MSAFVATNQTIVVVGGGIKDKDGIQRMLKKAHALENKRRGFTK